MAVIRDGDCLYNRPAAVTFVEVLGQRVGLSRTVELFSRWGTEGREPSDLTAAEVLPGLRDRNYVSEAVEGQYVEAVRACCAAGLCRSRRETSDAQG